MKTEIKAQYQQYLHAIFVEIVLLAQCGNLTTCVLDKHLPENIDLPVLGNFCWHLRNLPSCQICIEIYYRELNRCSFVTKKKP